MAAARIDWGALSSKLKPEAVNALNAFRRRHSDLTKTLNELNASASRSVDLAPYRSVLKNQKVVVAAESALKTFKPATLDLPLQIRAIEQHEALAVEQASKTATTIKAQLADLDVLLSSIETARPVDQLKVRFICLVTLLYPLPVTHWWLQSSRGYPLQYYHQRTRHSLHSTPLHPTPARRHPSRHPRARPARRENDQARPVACTGLL